MKGRVIAAAALTAAGSALTVTAPPAGASVPIGGYVMCVDQLSVTGVWIQASSGGSGWATRSGTGYQQRFSYSLPYGGSWTVHVGCGGSASAWKYAVNGNRTVSNTWQSWTCYPPDVYYYAFCQTS